MFDKVESFYRPASVREALRLLQSGNGRARLVAGCTDVVVEADRAIRCLIDIRHAGLTYIRKKDGVCAIGATTTMAGLEESAVIRGLAGGILAKAAATCGSIQIRNMATIGGNLANASPAADLAPPLLALEAVVVLAGPKGRRNMCLEEYLAPKTARERRKSLLVEVLVPKTPGGKRCGWSFLKLGRTALDIALVNVAAGLELDNAGQVRRARIALGSVAPFAMRARAAEELMVGRKLDRALLAAAGAEAARESRPISDVRASADYRREMIGVFTGRALEECAAQAGCSL